MPELALVAEDSCVRLDTLSFMAAALDLQMARDCAPLYGQEPWACIALASLDGVRSSQAQKVLTFRRSLDVPGALGFHTQDWGIEYAEALAPPEVGPDDPIDGTVASHEFLETFADPDVSKSAVGPGGSLYDYEICDAVEADSYFITATIGAQTRVVAVSNFVLPAWFGGASGPFDFMRLLSGPWQMTSGGYAQFVDREGHTQQVFADLAGMERLRKKLGQPTKRVTRRARDRAARACGVVV